MCLYELSFTMGNKQVFICNQVAKGIKSAIDKARIDDKITESEWEHLVITCLLRKQPERGSVLSLGNVKSHPKPRHRFKYDII